MMIINPEGVGYSHVRLLSHLTFRRCLRRTFLQTYAVLPAKSLVSLPGSGARAYLSPLASNTLLVPPDSLSYSARHRARYACGLANACALVYVAA